MGVGDKTSILQIFVPGVRAEKEDQMGVLQEGAVGRWEAAETQWYQVTLRAAAGPFSHSSALPVTKRLSPKGLHLPCY